MSTTCADGFLARPRGRLRPRRRVARPGRRSSVTGSRSTRRAPIASSRRSTRRRSTRADVHRPARVRRLRRRRARPVHRLDAVLPHVGHPLAVPRGAHRPGVRRRRTTAVRRRARDARQDRRRSLVPSEGGRRHLAGQRRNGDDVDDIVVFADESRTDVLATLHGIRQQAARTGDRPNYSISDFVAPVDSGVADYVGRVRRDGRARGDRASPRRSRRANDDYSSILLKALADRLAEAFAERIHERVRTELWGYAPDEHFAPADLLDESFRGIRPAPGYPAQPDHTEKVTLFELLDAPNTGRRRADRVVRDVARLVGVGTVPRPSRVAGTSASATSAATSSSRTPPARGGRSRRPSTTSRPCSTATADPLR